MSNQEQVSAVLKHCQENMCLPNGERLCLVCDVIPQPGDRAHIGVFIANESHQKRLGAPANKSRLIIYMLCDMCYELPDRNERVEKKIFTTVSVQ